MSYNKRLKDISEEEYNDINKTLHDKVNNKENISEEDKIFFCDCLKFQDLALYSFCLDEYYRRMFLFKHPLLPKELNHARQKDIDNYAIMVKEWHRIVNITDNGDLLINMVGKETRKELKELRKSHPIINFYNFNSASYNSKKTSLLEWSKFRYLMIKNIWVGEFHSAPYKLYLDGTEIVIDEESLAHILSRHYGEAMKNYHSDKSFFTKDILHTEIHTKLEDIFEKIDYYALYRDQPINEINIRLNGALYRIYCEKKELGSKKNKHTITRVSTIFPIENEGMLLKVNTQFDEYMIDKSLSVFLKNI